MKLIPQHGSWCDYIIYVTTIIDNTAVCVTWNQKAVHMNIIMWLGFLFSRVKNTCNYIHVHSNINANNCIIYIPIGGCETPLQTLTKTIIVKWKNIRCLCHLTRVSGAAAVGTEHRMEEVHTLQT